MHGRAWELSRRTALTSLTSDLSDFLRLTSAVTSSQVARERHEIQERFSTAILEIQQKAGLKYMLLEKKILALRDELEERDASLSAAGVGQHQEVRDVVREKNKVRQQVEPELSTCGIFALQLKKNYIFILFYQSFLKLFYQSFLSAILEAHFLSIIEAGCFSSPCPKEGYFQSWALVVLY